VRGKDALAAASGEHRSMAARLAALSLRRIGAPAVEVPPTMLTPSVLPAVLSKEAQG